MAKFTERATFAASAAALVAAPVGAEAARVDVTGSPLSISFLNATSVGPSFLFDQVAWDVDGNGTDDFNLFGLAQPGGSGAYGGHSGQIFLGFNGIAAGSFTASGLVGNGNAVGAPQAGGFPVFQPVPASNSIGLTQNAYFPTASAGVGTYAPFVRSYPTGGGTNTFVSSALAGYPLPNGGFFDIGFSFDIGGNTHFGTALIQTAGMFGSPDWTLVVHQWSYENTPDTPIHVFVPVPEPEPEPEPPPVPVPASIVPMVTLLGLGAAGLRRMRKQKTKTAAA